MLSIANLKKNKEVPKLFSVVLDQVFMSITTFLTTIVLARTYDKIEYADIVLLFSITVFILGFQSAIISKPYAINLNDFKGEKHFIYYHFNLHLKLYFTIFVLLIFPLLYFILFDIWDSKKLIVFTVYITSNISYFFVRETLLSERKTKKNLFYGLGCSLGLIILLSFIFFRGTLSVYTYLNIASFIYIILTFIYLINHLKKSGYLRASYKDLIKYNWKVGKWLLGSNVLFFLSSSIYPWLLLYITNKDDIAVYGVLISVSSIVNPLLSALSSYMLPLFVNKNSEYGIINLMVKKWTILFGVLSFFLVIIGFFLGQQIINTLFGEKYMNLGVLVIFPFLVQAINVLFQPLRISLNAIKRTDVNFWVLIPRSVIAILLGYYLISKYGLAGAFYTMVIENTLYQILNFVMYRNIVIKKNSNTNSII